MLKQVTLFLMLIMLNTSINGADATPMAAAVKTKVILINGTSCSGKSTITHILKSILSVTSGKWAFVAQDDEDLEDGRALEEKFLQYDLAYDHRLILNKILELTKAGYSVVCDLILYKNEEIAEYLRVLKDYQAYTVLVHCHPSTLLDRARSRSSDPSSPQAESTSASKAVEDYTEMFGPVKATTPSSKILTRIHSGTLKEMRQKSVEFQRKQSLSGLKLSPADKEELKLADAHVQMADKFSQSESDIVDITPEYEHYDLVVDTSEHKPEVSIDQILEIMKK
jgi:chloramphenicol 3-O-phosphotransferase